MITILQGDARQIPLSDGTVQCCVTSPPYFGLRNYGVDGQIGLEPSPEAYVAQLVEVFRGVRRALREDGTLWLNLGDSYCYAANRAADYGLKPKDLIGIPWRVAFALQADGWYLRQDIIWHKPDPIPESIRDRCTKAHEYLFLLSKSKRYYFDADAIKEPSVTFDPRNVGRSPTIRRLNFNGGMSDRGVTRTTEGLSATPQWARTKEKKNRRSVWTIAKKPFKGAHFATFPPALVEPCILAGSRPGDLVLDPFGGSGTTALVARQHGRRAVLIELNPDYIAIARERLGMKPTRNVRMCIEANLGNRTSAVRRLYVEEIVP